VLKSSTLECGLVYLRVSLITDHWSVYKQSSFRLKRLRLTRCGQLVHRLTTYTGVNYGTEGQACYCTPWIQTELGVKGTIVTHLADSRGNSSLISGQNYYYISVSLRSSLS